MGLFDGFFGGGSGGNSTSSSTSIDKRMSIDGSSLGISSDSSTVNILDAGAIGQAVNLARAGLDVSKSSLGFASDSIGALRDNYKRTLDFAGANADTNAAALSDSYGRALDFASTNSNSLASGFQGLLDLAGGLYSNAFKMLDSSQKVVASSGDLVATAYDNARGQGDSKSTLFMAAMAVVAVVALAAFAKGKL